MMILPEFQQELDNSSLLPALTARIESEGGSIILNTRNFAFVVITVTRTIYEFVPNGNSPYVAGLKHSLVTLLFGWFSWSGPFLSLRTIIANSMAGLDVTHLFQEQNHLASMPFDSPHERLKQKENRIQIVFAIVILAALGAIYWKFVFPIFDPSLW